MDNELFETMRRFGVGCAVIGQLRARRFSTKLGQTKKKDSPNRIARTPSTRPDGRRALVTGAGRGIGLACAAALAQAGAHVVLAARTTSEVEEVARAICRDGGMAEAITLDITDLAALNGLIASLEPFDVLVNNAGTNRPVTFLEVAVNDFDYMVSLNFLRRSSPRKLSPAGWWSSASVARSSIYRRIWAWLVAPIVRLLCNPRRPSRQTLGSDERRVNQVAPNSDPYPSVPLGRHDAGLAMKLVAST